MTLDLPSSLDVSIKEDRKWADSLLGKSKSSSKPKKDELSKKDSHKKRKSNEDDDVVITDLRPIAERLHEKVEQAAAARKRKTESGDQPPPKKVKAEKKHKAAEKRTNNFENGSTTTSGKHKTKIVPKEESSDDDIVEEEDSEVIHIDDYFNELTERVLNASYNTPNGVDDSDDDDDDEDNEDYDEDIRLKLLGLKKPESAMSPELEEDLQYGTFDFSSGQPIPKYLSKGAKRTKRLEYLIKKADRRQQVLANNSDRADEIRWNAALNKATGGKEFDDAKKMRKMLKKIGSKKQKSKADWKKRIEDTKAQQERRQAKRKANIANKVATRKANKINKRFGIKSKKKSTRPPSSGGGGSSNKKRPGFEGRKQSFLNK